MRPLYMLGLMLAAIVSASPASAATTTASVNCRSAPETSGRLVSRIPAGTSVAVMSRLSQWSLVDRVKEGCWVLSRYLDDGAANSSNFSAPNYRATRVRSSSRATRSHPRSYASGYSTPRKHRRSFTSRRSRSSFSYGGGSCPCSGGNVCIGPRGGRYCITSRGNKRYGV